jgi:phosphonate transport system substrate-binding protein
VLAALLLLLPRWPAWSAETNQASAPEIYSVGMAKVCFRNVNRNDAIAAYKVFLENAGRRFGNIYTAAAEVYDDTPGYEAAIQRQPMNVAVMDPWQYLTMNIHAQMKPFFTIMENGKVGRKYLVLTRRDSGLTNLAALRGKDIMELESVCAGVGKAWFDILLLSEKLGAPETFFGKMEVVPKPTAAVLPVFFGKKPACVVDEASFEMMKELNPQVGQMLQVLASSEIFADVLVCLREERWTSPKLKADTITALNELNQDAAGQQICTLFRIDRMVPFEDTQIETVRKLRATYESLQKEAKP